MLNRSLLRCVLSALIVLLAPSLCRAAETDDAWIARQRPLVEIAADRAAVDALLAALWQRFPDFDARLRAVVILRLGTPYVLGCLGEEKPPDPDPIFRLDQSDCTVHVLTCTALAHAHTYAEAKGWMTKLNYYPAPDPIRYANRIHYTEDRLATNPYFHIITRDVAPHQALAHVTLTLNRGADGKHVLDVPFEKTVTVEYLPLAAVTESVLTRLPKRVAGVAFVRLKMLPRGVVIAHEGTIVDQRYLIHADSIRKKTSRWDFLEYLKAKSDHFDGVIFYRIL